MMFIQDQIEIYEKPMGVPYLRLDNETGHTFVDLKGQPRMIDKLPELNRTPVLREFVQELNTPSSPYRTLGCEKWTEPWSHEQMPGFVIGSGSYVDIVFADISRSVVQSAYDQLIAGYRAVADQCCPYSTVLVMFKLKPTVGTSIEPGWWTNQGWWTLEFWNLGVGRSEEEAHKWWAVGVRCFKKFLLGESSVPNQE